MNQAKGVTPGADRVRVSRQNTIDNKRPFVVYVDARLLVAKNGVGRRFATESAARSAGQRFLFSSGA